MKPMVSVVVPVYNAGSYLNRCLSSIVNQTYKQLQIVLVNDGSTDTSGQLCDDWAKKDSRVKVIHQQNCGAGYARNTGLDNAQGEYICFIDSDDCLDVTAIEKSIESIEKYGSDTALFGLSHIYSDKTVTHDKISKDKLFYNDADIKDELIPSFFVLELGFDVGVVCKLFDSKVIRDNSLRFMSEREIYSEDSLFLLSYFSKCKAVSVVPENLYSCYDNDVSLSRGYKKEREEKLDAWLIKALEIADDENLSEKVKRHLRSRYQDCAMVGFKQVVLSDMSLSDKLKILKEEYSNPSLKSTLKKEVINLHGFAMRLFYLCVKNNMIFMSYFLLWLRLHK